MRTQIISALTTFLANFFTVLGTIILTVPNETWTDMNTYTSSFFASLILTAVRQALVKPLVQANVRP